MGVGSHLLKIKKYMSKPRVGRVLKKCSIQTRATNGQSTGPVMAATLLKIELPIPTPKPISGFCHCSETGSHFHIYEQSLRKLAAGCHLTGTGSRILPRRLAGLKSMFSHFPNPRASGRSRQQVETGPSGAATAKRSISSAPIEK